MGHLFIGHNTLSESVLRLTDVSEHPCWVGGATRVEPRAADSRPVAFALSANDSGVTHVALLPGRAAYVLLTWSVCTGPPHPAAKVGLRIIGTHLHWMAPTGGDALAACGRPLSAELTSTAVSASRRFDAYEVRPRPDDVALRMQDVTAPVPAPGEPMVTYGRTDLDGDGRPDLVVVRPSGLATAHLTRDGTSTVQLPANTTLRLQGLPRVIARDHHVRRIRIVLVSAQATADPHHLTTAMLRVWRGHLLELREFGRPFTLSFDRGDTGVYAGLNCTRRVLIEATTLIQPGRSEVDLTPFKIVKGHLNHVSDRFPVLPSPAAAHLAATRCPGLTRLGMAR